MAHAACPQRSQSFTARLASLLTVTDQAVAWYGAHRAWPANEPAQVRDCRAKR